MGPVKLSVTVTGPALQINLKIQVFGQIVPDTACPGPVHVGDSELPPHVHGTGDSYLIITRRGYVYAT
jgi:hypothetical protein